MHPLAITPPIPLHSPRGDLRPELVAFFQLLGYPAQPDTSIAQLTVWTEPWLHTGPYPEVAIHDPQEVWTHLDNLGLVNSPHPAPRWYSKAVILASRAYEMRLNHACLRHALTASFEVGELWYLLGDWYFDGHQPNPDPAADFNPSDLIAVWTLDPIPGFKPPQFVDPLRRRQHDLLRKLARHLAYTPGDTLLVASQPLLPARLLAARRILSRKGRFHIDAIGTSAHAAPATTELGLHGLARYLLEYHHATPL